MNDPTDPSRRALSLPDDQLRALGHRVVDLIADHWASVADRPPVTVGDAATLRERLAEPAPELGSSPDAVLDQVLADVLPFVQHGDHPRFFARIPGPSNPVGVFADALASGFNAFVGSWTGGSGPATIELVTLDWLRELCGLPEGSEGAFVSGGSVATLNALATARAARLGGHDPDAIVYVSDQGHASVIRALRVLGFGDDQIRVIPTGRDLALAVEAVAAMVASDRAAGRRPFCLVATAGSTNTGAVDPLGELADLCAAEGMWLHADAAYGGPAVLSATGRRLLAGLGRVDSMALDPHKWLFQPYEIGCVLVRHPGALAQAFALHPEYLADVSAGQDGEVNFFDRGVQLTRGFRALKLWMTIKIFGLAEIRAAIEHGLAMAEEAERLLRRSGWQIVTPAQLGIVSFRRGAAVEGTAGARAHAAVVAEMQAGGLAAVSSTVLHGEAALRMCTINPRTSQADIAQTVSALDQAWQAVQGRA